MSFAEGQRKLFVGGQAVIEGVMMRCRNSTAVAVRTADGEIAVDRSEVTSIADKYPILKKPFLRGTVALIESLSIGMKSLSYSARMAGEADEELTRGEIIVTILLAVALSVGLFIAVPTGAAHVIEGTTDSPLLFNLLEGLVRMVIFLGYIGVISQLKDIRRVFQYHGAEHQTIHCYEKGLPLTTENVQNFPRLHPRCGTNFLLLVMLVSIVVYAFLGWPDLWVRILSRILLIPVVAGIAYEIIRLAGSSDNQLLRIGIMPGMWLQYLTTRPPEDNMVEVAIESLKAVLPPEEIPAGSGSYMIVNNNTSEPVNIDEEEKESAG